MITQGQVYWVDLEEPQGSEPGYRRPVVVVQSDRFNSTSIRTVVVCILTTSLRRASTPGHIVLQPGESGLPHPSVANPTQLATINKVDLWEFVGSLPSGALRRVLAGIDVVLKPLEP